MDHMRHAQLAQVGVRLTCAHEVDGQPRRPRRCEGRTHFVLVLGVQHTYIHRIPLG